MDALTGGSMSEIFLISGCENKENMLQIIVFLFIFRLPSMPAGSQKSCTSLARRITYVLQWHKKDVKMQASVVSF